MEWMKQKLVLRLQQHYSGYLFRHFFLFGFRMEQEIILVTLFFGSGSTTKKESGCSSEILILAVAFFLAAAPLLLDFYVPEPAARVVGEGHHAKPGCWGLCGQDPLRRCHRNFGCNSFRLFQQQGTKYKRWGVPMKVQACVQTALTRCTQHSWVELTKAVSEDLGRCENL